MISLSYLEDSEYLTGVDEIEEMTDDEYKAFKAKGGKVTVGKTKVAEGVKTFDKGTVGTMNFKPKKKVTKEDLDIEEDLNAVFAGSDLTEEFKVAASEIFETAVIAKVNELVEGFTESLEEEFSVELEEHKENLEDKLSDFLDVVVENWAEENAISLDRGIVGEIYEDLMVGMRNLFLENYIDVPESKVDVVEELSGRIDEMEQFLADALDENSELKETLISFSKLSIVEEISNDLTDSQVEKLNGLAEAIEYVDEEDFKSRVSDLKVKYFQTPVNETTRKDSGLEDTSLITEENTTKVVDPRMAAYASAISKTLKK
jgi:hypothetical protein